MTESSDINGFLWAEVDLGQSYAITSLVIYGPVITAPEQSQSLSVYVGDNGYDAYTSDYNCGSGVGEAGSNSADGQTLNCQTTGRYITIVRAPDNGQRLGLCEIEVYGRTATYTLALTPARIRIPCEVLAHKQRMQRC
jgi:hypothetical protein